MQIALLLHLVGAITYFSGLVLAAVALAAARSCERPAEIALYLRLSRPAVAGIGIGFLLLLGFGAWLADLTGHDFGEAWLSVSLALFLAALVLGGIGGQAPKRARRLATELAGTGDRPSEELRALLRDPAAAVLNSAAGLASVAVLVLMVWRPGS